MARLAVVAALFPKELTDIFWAAFRVPNTFRNLFGEGAVTVSFLPVFTRLRKEKGQQHAQRLVSSAFWVLILLTGFVTLIGIFTAPWIVKALLDLSSFDSHLPSEQTAISMIRLMFPYLIVICAAALVGGALNATGRFFVPAFTPVFFNLSIMAGAYVSWRYFGGSLRWLALGVLFGGSLQLVSQLPALWQSGFPIRWQSKFWETEGLRSMLVLFLPASFALGVKQINTLVNTRLASDLGPGPISYLFYADRLAELPLGIFGFAIATAAFPRFAKGAGEASDENVRRPLIQSLKGILLVLAPSTVGLCILGGPLIDVVFNWGQFAQGDNLENTLLPLRVFAIGLIPFASVKLIGNLSYSLCDAKSPIYAAVTAAVVNFSLAYPLRFTFVGHTALALSVVVASIANVTVLLYRLRDRVKPKWFLEIVPLGLKVLVASTIMGSAVFGCLSLLSDIPSLLQVLGGTILGALVYGGCGMFLFPDLLEVLSRRMKREGSPK